LSAHGYRWNAERDPAVRPYRIWRDLVRIPIRMNDWAEIRGTATATELLQRWQANLAATVEGGQVIALGVHEWGIGRCEPLAEGFHRFLGEAAAEGGETVTASLLRQ